MADRVSRRAFLAITAILGASFAYLYFNGGGGNKSTSTSTIPITSLSFTAVHFPTLITEISFTNTTMDAQFLTMLKALNLDSVTLHTSPTEFNYYQSRFAGMVSAIRAQGMKVRFVLQDEPQISSTITPVPPTYSTPPTVSQYIATESAAAAGMASLHPDYISVVAEPTTIESRIGSVFTSNQWITIVQAIAGAVKATNPGTKTWVALKPNDGKEMNLIPNLVGISSLDGIGYDMYDRTDLQSTVSQAAAFGHTNGKDAGFLETWWQDIFYHPEYDNPANAPSEAAWIPSIFNFGSNNNAVAIFEPFFSHRFVTLQHIPSFTVAAFTAFNSVNNPGLAQDLASGNRTAIFQAYHDLIAGWKATH